MLDLAFAWLLGHPVTSSVIAGATKPEQVAANAATAAWKLTPEEVAEVTKLAAWCGDGEITSRRRRVRPRGLERRRRRLACRLPGGQECREETAA
jgi:diketogulonate reductase-like aldo/keto reductase